jgi:hypothetical protein
MMRDIISLLDKAQQTRGKDDYASFLFMEKNPKKAMPDLRWQGVSRQSLE